MAEKNYNINIKMIHEFAEGKATAGEPRETTIVSGPKKHKEEIQNLFVTLDELVEKEKDLAREEIKRIERQISATRRTQPPDYLKGLVQDVKEMPMADVKTAFKKMSTPFGAEQKGVKDIFASFDVLHNVRDDINEFRDGFEEMVENFQSSNDIIKKIQDAERDAKLKVLANEERRREAEAEKVKETKKTTGLSQSIRKEITGVLIWLHVLRIAGTGSTIVSTGMNTLGKSLGFLADMILLPLLPALIEISKFIWMIAAGFRMLPKEVRLVIAGMIAIGGVLAIAIHIYNYVNVQLALFGANLAKANAGMLAKTGTSILGPLGGAAAGTGGAVAGFGAIAAFGTLLTLITGAVTLILGTGTIARQLNNMKMPDWMKAATFPVRRFGWEWPGFGKKGLEAGLQVAPGVGIKELFNAITQKSSSFSKNMIEIVRKGNLDVYGMLKKIWTYIVGIFYFLANMLGKAAETVINTGKLIKDIGKAIWDWLLKSLGNIWNLGVRLAKAIWKWIVDSLGNAIDLGKKLWVAIVKWFTDSLSNVLDLGGKLWTSIKKWFSDSLSNTITTVKELWDLFVNWVKSGFANPVGFLQDVINILLKWVRNEFNITLALAKEVGSAVLEFIVKELSITTTFALDVIKALIDFVVRELGITTTFVMEVISSIIDFVVRELSITTDLAVQIKNLILDYIKNNIPGGEAAANAVNTVSGAVGGAVNWVKGVIAPKPSEVTTPVQETVQATKEVVKTNVTSFLEDRTKKDNTDYQSLNKTLSQLNDRWKVYNPPTAGYKENTTAAMNTTTNNQTTNQEVKQSNVFNISSIDPKKAADEVFKIMKLQGARLIGLG